MQIITIDQCACCKHLFNSDTGPLIWCRAHDSAALLFCGPTCLANHLHYNHEHDEKKPNLIPKEAPSAEDAIRRLADEAIERIKLAAAEKEGK